MEVDCAVGTVEMVEFELDEDLSVLRKLARDRRLRSFRSLKKGMIQQRTKFKRSKIAVQQETVFCMFSVRLL